MSDDYDLVDLCRLSAATPRTVRYYIQQGLLEPPDSRGPKARYGPKHLERLRLIKRLQRRHLPLSEIRQMLDELSEEDVRQALGEAAAEQATSALDYIQAVRNAGRPGPSGPRAPSPSAGRAFLARESSASGLYSYFAEPEEMQQSQQDALGGRVRSGAGQPAFGHRSRWERISLGPNVELQVRRPLSRSENRSVERLLEAARDLFERDRGEES